MPLLRCRWHHLHRGVKLAARAVRETGQLVSSQHTPREAFAQSVPTQNCRGLRHDRAAESHDHCTYECTTGRISNTRSSDCSLDLRFGVVKLVNEAELSAVRTHPLPRPAQWT